ncbi:ABC-type transport auxiliary lipoprotein family protein [uncultured Erythrobacter sp.]|uniref:ABC-type transport auxiliary lipoprotein family protein n=1 Tax=uncultured Erythrobacter sp. TaxID=263913 RepID=UPI0026124DE2|nr:ABC-type transport auxiliary lipoprotein family protein [uncultured Erythrobacter sp.]
MITTRPLAGLIAASLLLSGCVSIGGGGEPPESLLTLTASASAPAGSGAVSGVEGSEGAIAVLTPEVPAKLNVIRVPVTVSATEIAYLPEAVWIEKPAHLFRKLLGETLRTASGEPQALLVLDTDDTPLRATQSLRGTLIDMGYEAANSAVVVRFEAVHTNSDGKVMSRRFEAREEGVLPTAASVGPALNTAANAVAKDVAAWVKSSQ